MSIKYKGKILSFEIIGESHSKEILIKTKGYPKTKISLLDIDKELEIRNAKEFFNTQRKESDKYEIISGIKNEKIIKNNFTIKFYNEDANKENYKKNDGFLRPNQSDYSQLLKTKEIRTGAGEFSGRMTLPIVFVGTVARTILKEKGIEIASRIKEVLNLKDNDFDDVEEVFNIQNKNFPTLTEEFKNGVYNLLENIKNEGDAVGSKTETIIKGLRPGIGNAYFERMESKISKMIFSIPTIKALEFGLGTEFVNHKSSKVQDKFILEETIKTKTNNCGGINGGVTNGMPIVLTTTSKPIATIAKPITSLNYKNKKQETVEYKGNHDVFIGNRIIPVIESVIAIGILDELLYEERNN